MSTPGSGTGHYIQRPKIEDQIHKFIEGKKSHLHLFGEPGVGKTQLLENISDKYRGEIDVEIIRIREHNGIGQVFKNLAWTIYENLPKKATKNDRKLTGISLGAGASAGVSWENTGPEASKPTQTISNIIQDCVGYYPDDKRLLICIDDVHKISDNDYEVYDVLEEISDLLPEQIVLISSGQITYSNGDTAIRVGKFSEQQTSTMLTNHFINLSRERIADIHKQLDGHPLYINLLINSNDPDESPEIPKYDIQEEIQRRYLQSIPREHRRFLRITSPLPFLSLETCSWVLPDDTPFDRTMIKDILYDLSGRSIIRKEKIQYLYVDPEMGVPEPDPFWTGYFVHDTLREFLQQNMDPDMRETIKERNRMRSLCERRVHWFWDAAFMYEDRDEMIEDLYDDHKKKTTLPAEDQISLTEIDSLFKKISKMYMPLYFPDRSNESDEKN